MKNKQSTITLLSLIVIFLFLRLYQLPQKVNFSMEQGKILLDIYNLWQNKKITLVGLETSIKTASGRGFFQGPWVYYLPLPALLISNWHPLSPSYLIILFNLAGLIFLFKGLKNKFNLPTAFFSGFLFTIMPRMVKFSQFIWNPNFLPFTSCLLIYLLLKISKKSSKILFFLTGLTLGFGLGHHYQFILIIIFSFLWMLYKKFSFKSFLITFSGIIIAFSPLIIFELRHNFYNLKTILLILKNYQGQVIKNKVPFHYFISFMPFIFLFISLLLEKIFDKKTFLQIIFVSLLILYSFLKIVPPSDSGFTMPQHWNFPSVTKTAEIIFHENYSRYNIANLLYGDTRAHALRYLLTVKKDPPLPVEQYSNADSLFAVSYQKGEQTIKNPVWEISSFCPCIVKKEWKINNQVNLFLLEKIK